MNKEREPASGAAKGARRATGGAPEERRDGRGRWSAKRKFAAVLRLLRGEDLETVSRELGVTAATLSGWREQFLEGGAANLKAREADVDNEETQRLKSLVANPRWGAPRIHGELLRLGFELSQATVAKYTVHRRRPPSQTWRTFLQNHAKDLDFFVVPTVFFDLLFVFVILSHDRRRVVHFGVTAYPTAEWAAKQLMEAFPWNSAPRYLLRDRDGSYGEKFCEASSFGLGCRRFKTASCCRSARFSNTSFPRLRRRRTRTPNQSKNTLSMG